MLDQAMTGYEAPRALAHSRPLRWSWAGVVGIGFVVMMVVALGAPATAVTVAGLALVMTSSRLGRHSPWLASRLLAHARRKAIRDGRERRKLTLLRAGVRDHELADLTSLVDEIAHRDSDAVDRFDLEALLDRYVDVEIARTRVRNMLERFDRGVLSRQLAAIPLGSKRMRRDLLQRRLTHIDACGDRAAALDDDVDELRELLCLLAQRTSAGDGDVGGDTSEIERRVMLLESFDELDAPDDDIAMLDPRFVVYEPSLRDTGS